MFSSEKGFLIRKDVNVDKKTGLCFIFKDIG